MSQSDDEDDLDKLLRPLSATVEPKHTAWAQASLGFAASNRTGQDRARKSAAMSYISKRKRKRGVDVSS